MLDIILKNCSVIDGVSDTAYLADIGIMDDIIIKVGNLKEYKAVTTIDCQGKFAAPGFIDVHSHSDLNPFIDNGFDSKLRQGVTTEIIGNCGYSVYPLKGEFAEKVKKEADSYDITVNWESLEGYVNEIRTRGKLALNIIPLAGLSAVRTYVNGYNSRALNNKEIGLIKQIIDEMMLQGAFGVSSGMIYPPCCYFEPEELFQIISTVAKHNGVYTTHMRSESDGLLEALNETLQITRRTGVNTQISHLKTAEKHNWHKIDSVFELIEEAIKDGFNVSADRYPYLASQTSLDMVLPKWVFDGGDEMAVRRLLDPIVSQKIRSEILKYHSINSDYWENIIVSQIHTPEFKKYEGLNFTQIYGFVKSLKSHCQKFDIIDALFFFLACEKMKTSAIFFNMCEKNLEKILGKNYVMIGSDATARTLTGPLAEGKPHPRAFSTFVKYLTDFVTRKHLFSLPKAISKITYLPAQKFNIFGRGRIAPSFYADIVIFDLNNLKDNSNYVNPFNYPDGMELVIINGKVAFDQKDSLKTKNKSYNGRVILKNENAK